MQCIKQSWREKMNKKATPSRPALRHPNAIGIKEGLGYMFGDIGNLLVLTFISTYLKVFYTDSLFSGFMTDEAARERVMNDITVLFLATRLWDAVNDPLWGLIVDARRPTKEGKFRPYIKVVAIPLTLSCILCFMNLHNYIDSYVLLLIFAYVSYTAFGMLYTGMNIPYGSLASVITDDPKGRTLLSTFRSIGGGVGGAPVTLIGQLIIYKKTINAAGESVSAFDGQRAFMLAVVFSVLSMISYMFCYKSTKERVLSPIHEKKKINIKLTYGSLFKSVPFITVMLSGILISGLLQYGSFNQYLFKNYFGESNLSVLNTICTYAPMAALILFMPKLVEKFGKKELCVFGLFIASFASIFNAVFLPGKGLYFTMQALTGFGYSFMSITNWAIVMDVIDYQELKTGVKNESAIYAVYTFARKLGQTIADSGGMQLLKFTGYSDKVKNEVTTAKGSVGHNIYRICTIVPAAVYSLILILTIIYPLSKKKLVPINEELMKRRGERMEGVEEPQKEISEER